MAKFAATDYKVTINGTDYTSWIAQVELNIKYADIDTTAFGQTGVSRTNGLIDGDVKIDFHQDFGPGTSIDSLLYTLMTATTVATVVITPTSATVGSNNPKYTVTCKALEYTPFSSSVGDLATVSFTMPLSQSGTTPSVVRAIA